MAGTPTPQGRTQGPVLVVGAGLLGASVGLALTGLGVDVMLSDVSPGVVALARDLGAGRLPEPGEQARLVVIAAPPDVLAPIVVDALAAHPEAIVTDVASVKAAPLADLLAAGVDLTRYVGGHPLAGRERSGPIAARNDLFVGRPWVLTPTEQSSAAAVAAVRDLVVDLGAFPVTMAAHAHDRAVALISHVPQVLSSLVAARLLEGDEAALSLSGQGLRDTTRIAGSDPALWVTILTGNAGPVADLLTAVRADLDETIGELRRLEADIDAVGPRAGLARVLDAGVRGHARIPGKHGTAAVELAVVVVQVPDRPGEIGRILAAMGEAGVNLEDLRIEHVPGRRIGLAEISVLPAALEEMLALLERGGWTVAA